MPGNELIQKDCVGRAAPDGGRRSLPYKLVLIAVLDLREPDAESLKTRERVNA
jgi:hypothetical protein